MYASPTRLSLAGAVLALLLLAAACGGPTGSEAPQGSERLELAQLETYRTQILPAESERRWEQIDWLTTYADGLRAASDAEKPLLLYVMNGHPLACT